MTVTYAKHGLRRGRARTRAGTWYLPASVAAYDFINLRSNSTYAFDRNSDKRALVGSTYTLFGTDELAFVTGQGVDLEAASTNLVKYHRNLSEWTTSVGGTTAIAEGGGTRLGLFNEPYTIAATNTSGRLETKDADAFAVTSGAPVYLTYWYAAGTSTTARVTVRQVGGTPSNCNGTLPDLTNAGTTAGVMDQIATTELAADIYMTQCRWTPNFTGNTLVGIGPQNAAGLTIIALGAQAETGTLSSPVLSDGSQASRAADVLDLLVPNAAYDVYLQTYEDGHVWLEDQVVSARVFTVDPALLDSPLELAFIFPATTVTEQTVADFVGSAYRTFLVPATIEELLVTPQTAGQSWSMQQDRRNPWTFLSETRNNDEWPPDAGRDPPRERSEVWVDTDFGYDEDVWFKFRQTVTATPPFVPEGTYGFHHHHVMQWHCAAGVSGTSPIVSFHLTNDGVFQVKTRGENVSGGEDAAFLVQYEDEDFEFGVEYEYRVHIVFSPTAGVLEVWRDDVKIVDGTGLAIGYPDDTFPYPKFGVYRTATLGTVVVLTKLGYFGSTDPG